MKVAKWQCRSSVELLLLVAVWTFGIRSFFLHPMAIPTGSMAPTFVGLRVEQADVSEYWSGSWTQGLSRLMGRALSGTDVVVSEAKNKGQLEVIDRRPRLFGGLLPRQRYAIDGVVHSVWFPPAEMWRRAGVTEGQLFEQGEVVVGLRVQAGDRILVNRLAYNFRRPRRGESVVLEASLIEHDPPAAYYLKRLVAWEGEQVSLGDDRSVYVNGEALDTRRRGFESVGAFVGDPTPGKYSGYLNNALARRYQFGNVAPQFPTAADVLTVPSGECVVLGDNTVRSLDSRTWGAIPREAMIGRPCFIFWPFTDRFGWSPY